MSDINETSATLQHMLAERNAAECDASKRDAEYVACRIANESLVHDLMRVMDERDRLQSEVQRLQAEVAHQEDHDCDAVVRANMRDTPGCKWCAESSYRDGQEAMLHAVKGVCAELMGGYEDWRGLAEDDSDYWRAEGCLLAMEGLVHKLPTVGEKK